MAVQSFDIIDLSSLQEYVSNLTALYLSFYDQKGNIILPAVNENRLLTTVRSSQRGKDDHDDFIRKTLERIEQRSDILFCKGPEGQCHFFIPLRTEDSALVLVGGGVFVAANDFEDFYKKKGQGYGLTQNELESLSLQTHIKDFSYIQTTARLIRSVFNLFLRNSYKASLHEKRYRISKTILGLFTDTKAVEQTAAVCNILIDIIIFLFNIDSTSIMIRENDVFKIQETAGKLREHLQSTPLKLTGLTSVVVEKQLPLYSESVLDISKSGFNDKVTSVYMFPIISDEQVMGILNILNAPVHKEDADIISLTCMIVGCILHRIKLRDTYEKCLKDLAALNLGTEYLLPLKDPDMVYEAILNISVRLTETEKGSLMLADEDASHLTIKAAKGIDKRLFGEISIKAGEGIAGRVFKEGKSLMVTDIEKSEWAALRRPRYRTGSFISIPLKKGQETAGVLNISDKITGEVFSAEDMSTLSSFASYASIALERSNYYSLASRLRELSITDSLTGLFNRRYFEERFLEEIQRSKRHNLSFSLVMIDIDDFKLFNDTEGHLAGDEVLKCIARHMRECLRMMDVVARFGGEEFVAVMPQTTKEEALIVSERIRTTVKQEIPRIWRHYPKEQLTVSVGIAAFPADGEDGKDVLNNADRALYRAKLEGKDRTVLWEA